MADFGSIPESDSEQLATKGITLNPIALAYRAWTWATGLWSSPSSPQETGTPETQTDSTATPKK